MDLDLTLLSSSHPILHTKVLSPLVMHAGLSLQLRSHAPGVLLEAQINEASERLALCWTPVELEIAHQTDRKRNTEDGAEAVSLAIAGKKMRWCFRRRLQQGEYADYLLSAEGTGAAARSLVALEVSGAAETDSARLKEKLFQVGRCWLKELEKEPDIKAACVVEFGPPRARLATLQTATG